VLREMKTIWNPDQEIFASVAMKIRNSISRRNQKKELLMDKIEGTVKRRNLITVYGISAYKVKVNFLMK